MNSYVSRQLFKTVVIRVILYVTTALMAKFYHVAVTAHSGKQLALPLSTFGLKMPKYHSFLH